MLQKINLSVIFLLISFLSFSLCISIKLNDLENGNIIYKDKCNIKGFSADYVVNNIEVIISQFQSYAIPFTYHEYGSTVVDYENNMVYYDYHDSSDGSLISGKSFVFFNNYTQYVYSNNSGVESCQVTPNSLNIFQKISELKKVGSTRIGTLKCDIFENTIPIFNFTNQVSIIDPSDCSIVSVRYENTVSFKGNGAWDFFNFRPEVDYEKLKVPSVCFEKQ